MALAPTTKETLASRNGASLIIHYSLSIIHLINTTMTINKNVWKNIIQFLITVLTALGTAFGVTSCM